MLAPAAGAVDVQQWYAISEADSYNPPSQTQRHEVATVLIPKVLSAAPSKGSSLMVCLVMPCRERIQLDVQARERAQRRAHTPREPAAALHGQSTFPLAPSPPPPYNIPVKDRSDSQAETLYMPILTEIQVCRRIGPVGQRFCVGHGVGSVIGKSLHF